MRISRRRLTVGVAAALATARARADAGEDDPLDLRTLRIDHEVLLALPRDPAPPGRLVVLLHGLAETSDEHTGARAWVDRYGLATAVQRLIRAPIVPISSRDDWGSALATTNAALAAHPYRGLAFACPFVPRMASDKLDAYARWIDDVLVPRVRAEAGERLDPSPPRIGGCSYGGLVSLEVFLRTPRRFATWAGVQTAISKESAGGYADRLAGVAAGRPLFLETSARDPFHDATVALAAALHARSAACDLVVLPGPHDQPWLREAGTPSALAWLDRT